MDNIQDINSYVRSMSTTLIDKCWWLDKIPDTIDTIVDYGCAQGDLAIYVDSVYPGRFKYIGIDNSPEMLALASHNHHLHFGKDSEFYSEISGISNKCDTSKAILVLNSVMHEIFSYLTDGECNALFAEMFGAGFYGIAIRDMYMPSIQAGDLDLPKCFDAIKSSPYEGMWYEYNVYVSKNPQRKSLWFEKEEIILSEFLMKYRYVGNWKREMKETYFWNWVSHIRQAFENGYAITYDERFSIPFIRERIMSDFGIEFNIDTHRRVLLTR